jgi:hypothetical protein
LSPATAASMYRLLPQKADKTIKVINRNNIPFSEIDLGSCLKSWPEALRLRLGNLRHYGVAYGPYGSRGL